MVRTEIHRIERVPKAKDLVLPLLRSPYKGGRCVISEAKRGWAAFPLISSRHNEVRDLILGARIGGNFWQTPAKVPAGPREVVILPTDLERARRLWIKIVERHRADSLLIICHPCRATRPILREIVDAGASTAPPGDAYPILDIASSVYADEECDIGSLAAIAGIPSFRLYGTGLERVSSQEISAKVDDGTSYTNPYTAVSASIEEIAEILNDWRRMFTRNRAIGVCAGVSLWKRRQVKQLLYTGETAPAFRRSAQSVLSKAAFQGRAVGVWSSRMPTTLESEAQRQKIQLFQMEDGFIRSFGLGSALTAPASIVADCRGIYFDPAKPSDLEVLSSDTVFSEAVKRRASRLIDMLNAKGVSKYSLGGAAARIEAKPDQRIILVPGQVADDLSLRLGAKGSVATNLGLLKEVRRRHPEACIIYRPHPDVVAGYRQGKIADSITSRLADQVVTGGSIAALLSIVDEVHTMTSLAGFEALLRGCKVETYGQPFYAGWGLTKDHAPVRRRQRQLQLEELVAAALILYPNYIDPMTGMLCGPETLVARLSQPELWHPTMLMRLRHFEGKCRRLWASRSQIWSRLNA